VNEPAKLELRAPDISRRFLARTKQEVARSRELFAEYLVTPNSNLLAILNLAHKIHGSGALFGFEALSQRAHCVEKIAARQDSKELTVQLEDALRALESQVDAELRGRPIPD
jgi:HPt (histidine-containing phosphotransfer) domain-containing protein